MRAYAFLAMGCLFGVAACSLLVDTSGLASSSSDSLPADTLPDAGDSDAAQSEPTPSCDGVVCPAPAHGVSSCEVGHCKITCNKGFGDCDGDETNGCEASLDADPANCGACKRDCGGGSCDKSACGVVLLASSQSGASGIAVDATNVYWSSSATGKINKCPLAGCGPSGPTSISTTAATAYLLAIDATSVYWNDYSGNRIYSCPLGGCGSPTILANTPLPAWVTLDDAAVYWTSQNGDVRKVNKDGTNLVTLVTHTTDAGAPGSLAVADDTVYFASTGKAAVYKCARSGCPGGPTLLVGSQTGISAIAIDATHVYWTTSNEIRKAPLAGGAPVTLAASQQNPTSIVLSDTDVYWTNDIVSGSIASVPKSGGAVKIVATNQNAPVRITMDAEWLYWANYGSGSIMKLRRDLAP